jgi:AcrR family transcriptional regulator
MSRWAPDARERLEAAALELFAQNGYEPTTVSEIAERAGLNRATFFRYFADKREVLFGGEDTLSGLFADGIRACPAGATPIECVRAAFAASDPVMTDAQRTKARQRVLILAANEEVQERGLLKHARMASAIRTALTERGLDAVAVRLAAELALLAFSLGVERWMQGGSFSAHATEALRELQSRAAELDERAVSGAV